MAAGGFGEGLEFGQGAVGLAELEPEFGAAHGEGLAQGQTGGGGGIQVQGHLD
jgi:hypothetical protein